MMPPRAIRLVPVIGIFVATLLVGSTAPRAKSALVVQAEIPSNISYYPRSVLSDTLAENCYFIEERVLSHSGKTETQRTQECD